ncbi:MAG: hypothetical protein ACLSEX_08100 [Blautia sp.]
MKRKVQRRGMFERLDNSQPSASGWTRKVRFSALQGMDPDVVQCRWKDGAETAAEIGGNGGKA